MQIKTPQANIHIFVDFSSGFRDDVLTIQVVLIQAVSKHKNSKRFKCWHLSTKN